MENEFYKCMKNLIPHIRCERTGLRDAIIHEQDKERRKCLEYMFVTSSQIFSELNYSLIFGDFPQSKSISYASIKKRIKSLSIFVERKIRLNPSNHFFFRVSNFCHRYSILLLLFFEQDIIIRRHLIFCLKTEWDLALKHNLMYYKKEKRYYRKKYNFTTAQWEPRN